MNSDIASNSLSNSQKIMTLIGTIIVQFALGSAYTWSLFNHDVANLLGVEVYKVALTFGLFCFFLAIASSQAGYIQNKIGVRHTTIISAVLMLIGLFIAAKATKLYEVYLGAGVIMGMGEGTVYLMTLTNCVKIFPKKKGLISSLSIGAYGLGGVVFKYINYDLLVAYGVQHTFMIWGAIVFVLMTIPAFALVNAPVQKTDCLDSLMKVMAFKSYWGFGIVFLITSMVGLYVISVAKDIGEQMVHLDAATAANAVAVLTFFNLCGRLVIGSASDKIGTLRSVKICQVILCIGIGIICYPALSTILFFTAVAFIAFAFGGTITVFPPLIGDFFGMQGVTKNYGFIYLGFGIGSVCGNIVSFIFNGFEKTIPILFFSMIIAVIIIIFTKNKTHCVD